jgi:ABC-type uncharacterized transport system ATPase subunit
MSESAIHTEGLTKHYGKVRALVDLDVDISAGEIFGYLGPNGSGKTTTIRTMLDEIRPTAGCTLTAPVTSGHTVVAHLPMVEGVERPFLAGRSLHFLGYAPTRFLYRRSRSAAPPPSTW